MLQSFVQGYSYFVIVLNRLSLEPVLFSTRNWYHNFPCIVMKRNRKLAIRRANPVASSQKTDKRNSRGAVPLSTIRLTKKFENVKKIFTGRKNNYFRSIHYMEPVNIEISIWRFYSMPSKLTVE